ncbi:MAG TPA: 4-hydroxy-tetrahydrodipicolinate reductase [Bacteroidia bacterium]|jgi:4-hydroxy-tetrahydrodipicolinate reductase|nr:4-hydroxy-tetrahydrodipicolinate reductase [Bacteroidia bacterium]
MNIVLFGYGKMGKEIEQIALQRKHNIVLKIDKDNTDAATKEALQKADVAIEFSTPHTVIHNISKCFDAGLPVVVGATGWYDKFEEIKSKCLQDKQALFYATNYSVGVNLFWKVTEQMAKLMEGFPEYEASIQEIHHIHKLDKPSGTAITTAEKLLTNQSQKKKWSIDNKDKKEELFIDVVREDEVPGTHTVYYKSAIDEINLTHIAYNRKGFALGAVLAAEFLKGKKGIYTMSDML